MAQQVHDKTGRVCDVCGIHFTAAMFNITITDYRKGDKFHVKRLACRKCANEYYSKNE